MELESGSDRFFLGFYQAPGVLDAAPLADLQTVGPLEVKITNLFEF